MPLAAAERTNVVMDFSGFKGRSVLLRNSAPPHESDAVFLPVLMRFDVLNHAKPYEETAIASLLPFTLIPPCIRRYCTMTLSELNKAYLMNERPFHAPVVVRPKVNTTEFWQIINLTDETSMSIWASSSSLRGVPSERKGGSQTVDPTISSPILRDRVEMAMELFRARLGTRTCLGILRTP